MHDLRSAHGHTAKNRTEIEASTHCGCFYCAKVFTPSDIVAWAGLELIDLDLPEAANAETALCPQCGSESVIVTVVRGPARPTGGAIVEASALVASCTLAGSEGGFRLGLQFNTLSSAATSALAGILT